jgi:hypothetical protein
LELYDAAIIGSGFYAVGLAESLGNSIIIDSHFLVDPVNYGTFCDFSADPCRGFSENSALLREIIKDAGAQIGDRTDPLALESCLAEYSVRRGIKFLLGATLLKTEKRKGYYSIKLLTNAGEVSVRAKRVINRSHKQLPDSTRILVRADSPLKLEPCDGLVFTVSEGFSAGELVICAKATAPMQEPTLVARAVRALEASDARPFVIAVAPRAFSSSINYPSALSAFEEGYKEGVALGK